MGQDLSIVLTAKKVADDALLEAARAVFADEPPHNLVLLLATSGPPSLMKVLPAFTALSIWADTDDGLDRFAKKLSREGGVCIVFTVADHSGVGGWQAYGGGEPQGGEGVAGDGYTEAGIRGIEATFRVKLRADEDDAAFFAASFMSEPRGLCVFGSAKGLRPGKPVGSNLVEAIMEFDLPDAELECLLLTGDD